MRTVISSLKLTGSMQGMKAGESTQVHSV